MAFLNKNVLRDVSGRTALPQNEGQSGKTVDLQTRQAYLEGCMLAVRKNMGGGSEVASGMLDAIGQSFKMGKDERVVCYDDVSAVSSSDENEFVDMVVEAVKNAGLSLRFLFDVETCASEKSTIGSAVYELIDRYVKGLSVDENTWRVQVLDSLEDDEKRKRWIDCCRQAAKNSSAHDAKYALAYWHFNGIIQGFDDGKAETLYRESAGKGNIAAQRALEAIRAKRAEEKRIHEEKEAQRKAAEERKKAKEEAEARRKVEEAAARRRAEIEESVLGVAKGVGCLLPIVLIGWFIWHLYSRKVERINTAANDILQNMIAIPGVKFKVGRTEVTQAQWYGIMGDNPSKHEGDNLPVENVSWYECQVFLEKLNESEPVRKSGMGSFRLPTEREWEYACRGGGSGDIGLMENGQPGDLSDLAWYDCGTTQLVATKAPNAYGLYDMHGNVFEWCSDLNKGLFVDDCVNKGGGFDKKANACFASARDSDPPRCKFRNTGLRVVCE